MKQFNNQFATQKLRENEAPGEEFIVNKVWDFLKTKPFPNPDYMPKFNTAEEIYNDFDSEMLKKYSEFDWKGDTEQIHPREKAVLQRRANYDKLAGTSDYMKHRQDPEYYEKEFQKTGTSDYFQRRGMDETSTTTSGPGSATITPAGGSTDFYTTKKKKVKKEVQDKENKLAAGEAENYAKDHWGWKEAPSIPNRSSEMLDYKELWPGKKLNENYSRFKKETKTRTNEQQFHTAMRLAERKIHEANRILEYTAQLKSELSVIKENKNTQRLMEKITRGIAEAYGKMKKMK